MGMYTQVMGTLNVASINGDIRPIKKAVTNAVRKSSQDDCYWHPEQILDRIHVLNGGNGSVFLAIAVEGKILGYRYRKDWQQAISAICEAIPTAEGRIEWQFEDDSIDSGGHVTVWQVYQGGIKIFTELAYRQGYGNGAGAE
jgi:hypothetical protein